MKPVGGASSVDNILMSPVKTTKRCIACNLLSNIHRYLIPIYPLDMEIPVGSGRVQHLAHKSALSSKSRASSTGNDDTYNHSMLPTSPVKGNAPLAFSSNCILWQDPPSL